MKEIILTQGKIAIVDDEDYEYLNQWKWHAVKNRYTFYAMRNNFNRSISNKRSLCMHRVVMNVLEQPVLIDHEDGNGLNNQKINLRAATVAQNCANSKSRLNSSSKYIGVNWKSKNNKWVSQITKDRKHIYLGLFDKEIDAAKAYNEAATKLHGEFANLNIIQ